jgi:tRNA-specific 2-thiouridylase
MTKDEVRAYALAHGIVTAGKADSQEICFVPDGRYAEFVEKMAPGRTRPGLVVDGQGRQLGRHQGVHRFTVGQRRGLGIGHSEPLYVEAVDAAAATVRVGARESLLRDGLVADSVVWTAGAAPADGTRLLARIRYRHRGVAATVHSAGEGRVEVRFDEAQEAVSPGQAVVFYQPAQGPREEEAQEVVGGAWIRQSLPVTTSTTSRTSTASSSQSASAVPASSSRATS